jgi:hypothetical protein
MIFKVKAKNLAVYDPLTDKFIAEFRNNTFETDDEAVIARLKKLEYYPEEATVLASLLVPVIKPEDISITPVPNFKKPLDEIKKKRGRPKKEKQ